MHDYSVLAQCIGPPFYRCCFFEGPKSGPSFMSHRPKLFFLALTLGLVMYVVHALSGRPEASLFL